MAKLISVLVLSLTAFLVFVVDAHLIRTTTTTTIAIASSDGLSYDDTAMMTESSTNTEGCSVKLIRKDLGECVAYVREAARGIRTAANPSVHIWACCNQMGQVDEDCICDALKKVVERSQQQQGQLGEDEKKMMSKRGRNIPAMCRMKQPHQSCDIPSN